MNGHRVDYVQQEVEKTVRSRIDSTIIRAG